MLSRRGFLSGVMGTLLAAAGAKLKPRARSARPIAELMASPKPQSKAQGPVWFEFSLDGAHFVHEDFVPKPISSEWRYVRACWYPNADDEPRMMIGERAGGPELDPLETPRHFLGLADRYRC